MGTGRVYTYRQDMNGAMSMGMCLEVCQGRICALGGLVCPPVRVRVRVRFTVRVRGWANVGFKLGFEFEFGFDLGLVNK